MTLTRPAGNGGNDAQPQQLRPVSTSQYVNAAYMTRMLLRPSAERLQRKHAWGQRGQQGQAFNSTSSERQWLIAKRVLWQKRGGR